MAMGVMTTMITPNPTSFHLPNRSLIIINSSSSSPSNLKQIQSSTKRQLLSITLVGLLATTMPSVALAESWGTRSFLRKHFFEPGLSPEDSLARIRQTAKGLHGLRDMLVNISWRYVIFYIRLKSAYLSQDLKTAVMVLPENRCQSYAQMANELVDNMAELDFYVCTPKVYESYLYYEKTLKSLDDLVALFA